VIIGRLARLLLLACTVLGVAALHTIGHAAVGAPDHHNIVTVSAPVLPGTPIAQLVPGEHGGCDGDGCDHQAIAPGNADDSSRWWEVCVAVLSVLALGALITAAALGGRLAPTLTTWVTRRPPPAARRRPVGLTLTALVVLRT
jgi:hypothetical protein